MVVTLALPPDRGCGPVLGTSEDAVIAPKQQVLELVRAHGRVARVEIARRLSISPGTVTVLTSELIASGYLEEVVDRPRESGRGRPPVALQVAPDIGRVVGVKLSDTRHAAMMLDFAGTKVQGATLTSGGPDTTPEDLAARVARLVENTIAQGGVDRAQVKAVGVGLPGLVDFDEGVVTWSPLLSARDVPLAAMLSDRLGIETLIENDANVLTLAELWFGKGRAMNSFAVFTIENGIGMGFVLDNRLFRGVRGLGMEIGHTKVQLDGALCRCGRRGCLEAYLADYALAREGVTVLGTQPGVAEPAAIVQALYAEAKAGNAAARSIFLRASRYLAVGLSNIMQLFDPERIIISGERLSFDYFYSEAVLEEMLALTLDRERYRDRVEIHAWEDQVWALGAAALALSAATDRAMAAS